MEPQFFIITGINPEPWAVGTIGWASYGGKRHPTMTSDPGVKTYQEAVKAHIKANYPQAIPLAGDVKLTFLYWRRLDKNNLTSTGRQSIKQIADTTNLNKATEDALQGIAFKNDRQVKTVGGYIVSQSNDTKPGILIRVEPAPPPPIDKIVPPDVWEEFLNQQRASESFDLSADLRMDYK